MGCCSGSASVALWIGFRSHRAGNHSRDGMNPASLNISFYVVWFGLSFFFPTYYYSVFADLAFVVQVFICSISCCQTRLDSAEKHGFFGSSYAGAYPALATRALLLVVSRTGYTILFFFIEKYTRTFSCSIYTILAFEGGVAWDFSHDECKVT